MAAPPTAVTVGNKTVHQVLSGEKLLRDNQQLTMMQQQLPQKNKKIIFAHHLAISQRMLQQCSMW